MPLVKWNIEERYIHLVFRISLWLKGLIALTEILGGIAAFFLTHTLLVQAADIVTQGELREDPHDLVANYLLHFVKNLSISTQHFFGFYFIGHGVIKLWLIVGLLRDRLWYYPTALIIFGLFIVYQINRFIRTHSAWLLIITAIDLAVIGLTWHEYRYLHRNPQTK